MTYLQAITAFHTVLSIVAIPAGALAVRALFEPNPLRRATIWFLALAIVTSVTGFLFPFKGVTPAVVTGVIALVILALVLLAYHRFGLERAWRWIYAAGMVASLYLLVFVAIVQAFLKVPALHTLAPTNSEPPFAIAQLVALVAFVALGIVAALRFRRDPRTGTGTGRLA